MGESGGFLDAVGDFTQLADPTVDAKWGPSVGWFQYRTLDSPAGHGYPPYDEMRDIGLLAGRAPGAELAPDESTAEAAAMYQAKAMWVLRMARGWGMWTIYRTGAYEKWLGHDYDLQLGHAEAARWNLTGTK